MRGKHEKQDLGCDLLIENKNRESPKLEKFKSYSRYAYIFSIKGLWYFDHIKAELTRLNAKTESFVQMVNELALSKNRSASLDDLSIITKYTDHTHYVTEIKNAIDEVFAKNDEAKLYQAVRRFDPDKLLGFCSMLPHEFEKLLKAAVILGSNNTVHYLINQFKKIPSNDLLILLLALAVQQQKFEISEQLLTFLKPPNWLNNFQMESLFAIKSLVKYNWRWEKAEEFCRKIELYHPDIQMPKNLLESVLPEQKKISHPSEKKTVYDANQLSRYQKMQNTIKSNAEQTLKGKESFEEQQKPTKPDEPKMRVFSRKNVYVKSQLEKMKKTDNALEYLGKQPS